MSIDRDELSRLRAENSDLKEGLHRYANGYQGSCYACEPVGMMNVAVRAENERLRGERDTAWAELRGIREAVNADPEESTLDEVRAAIERRDKALREARRGLERMARAAAEEDWLRAFETGEPFAVEKSAWVDAQWQRYADAVGDTKPLLAAIDAALGNVREGCQVCREEVLCTPDNCPYGQKGWRHTAHCVRHICAHDFKSGPWIELENGGTASCICGVTADSHDMRYAP